MKSSHLLFFLILLLSPIAQCQQDFDVHDYGATSDGTTDSTDAFLSTWFATCNSTTPATMSINGIYMINNIRFVGPCNNNVMVRINGTLVAPSDYREIADSRYWIMFKRINGIYIKGGTLNPNGAPYWSCKRSNSGQCHSKGPTSLVLEYVTNAKMDGLTSIDSLQMHISIHHCENTTLSGLNISARKPVRTLMGFMLGLRIKLQYHLPQSELGTIAFPSARHDRYHNSQHTMRPWSCIGSLGKTENESGVKNVIVSNSSFNGTTNGVRIKTWANLHNSFTDHILYNDLTMSNVENPIIIDQYYCPHGSCPKQTSRVKISNVNYMNIKGTSTTEVAITLNCSPSEPCSNISLSDINLSYTGNGDTTLLCNNVINGTLFGNVFPIPTSDFT